MAQRDQRTDVGASGRHLPETALGELRDPWRGSLPDKGWKAALGLQLGVTPHFIHLSPHPEISKLHRYSAARRHHDAPRPRR